MNKLYIIKYKKISKTNYNKYGIKYLLKYMSYFAFKYNII